MPYKIYSADNPIIQRLNPKPFRFSHPRYCEQDNTGFFTIDYTVTAQQDLVNYCPHTRETCVTETVIDKTNIEIPTFLTTDSALWLDADDSSTLTLVSGAVSEWRDKSGNNRHATQTTASNRPLLVTGGLNGTDVIRFDGSNDFLNVNYSIHGLTEVTFFVVGKRGNIDFSVYLSTDYAASPARGIMLSQSNTANAFRLDGRPTGGAYIFSSLSPQSVDYSIAYGQATNTGIQVGGNGLLGTLTTYSAPSIVSGSTLFIGSINASSQYSSIDANQIIIFPRVLTQAERQITEGYLAWSTGLQGNLPVGHPYKDSYTGVTITEVTTCTDFYDFAQAP